MVLTSMLLLCCASAHAGALSGGVFDELGAPVSGVVVYAYDARLGYATAVTTNSGAYRFEGLPAGRYRLRALPGSATDLAQRFWPASWSYCSGEAIELAEDGAVEGLDFALPPGARLRGVVTDLDGVPIAGATVTCSGAQGRVANELYRLTTDADGAFSFVGLDADLDAPALYSLGFAVDGWPDQHLGQVYDDDEAELVALRRGEDRDLGERALLDGISVSGHVEGWDGPVPEADVHVYASSQILTTQTDALGDYVVDGLPPGDVLSWASEVGYALTYWPDADRPGDRVPAPDEGSFIEGVDLTLGPEARLNGVFDGGDQDLSDVTVLLYNDSATVGIGAQAEADGAFTVTRLHGGDYTLFVYAETEGYLNDFVRDEGFEPVVYSVEPEADSPWFDVSLPLGAAVEGQVLDDAGAPVYGAAVYVIPDDERHSTEADSTDREGLFRVEGIVAGRFRIEVRYTPYCETDAGYVSVYWPGVVDSRLSESIALSEGEAREGLSFTMPVDDDHDGMSDAWELEHGLEVGVDDSGEDPDGDGYSNLEEYLLGTDPQLSLVDARDCGCGGGAKAGGLLPLALLFVRRRRRR